MQSEPEKVNSFSEGIEELHRQGWQGSGVRVGHLDSGIESKHSVFSEADIKSALFGYRFGLREESSSSDSNGHGTQTASLIVGHAVGNRYLGVAPLAEMYSGAVIESGNILARVQAGLDWLLDCRIQVASLSFGHFADSPVWQSLIQRMVDADMVVVASVGNRGAGIVSVPGAYPECLSVGACDEKGLAAEFSGSSRAVHPGETVKPDILAPGMHIETASANGTMSIRQGTSYASAQVAGLAVLLREAFPHASAKDVVKAIRVTSAPVATHQAHRAARGLCRPLHAFQWLSGCESPCPPPATKGSATNMDDPQACHSPRLPGFRDKRLTQRLSSVPEEGFSDAIIEFVDESARGSYLASLAADCEARQAVRPHSLRHAPTLIGHFSNLHLLELMEDPAVVLISSADIDRLALLYPKRL